MLRSLAIVTLLVAAAACGSKTKQPATTPAPTEATPAPAGDGAAGTDTGSAPTPDAEGATQDGTMKGDPCDGGE